MLPDNGVIVPGANVETASYGLTFGAGRVAMFDARTQYSRASMVALAASCGADDCVQAGNHARMPCGACRQVMVEFMAPDAPIWIDGVGAHKLSDLLPMPFKLTRMLP